MAWVWCSGGVVWLDPKVVGSLAFVWSLGGYGLMPGSCGMGLARWCDGNVVWLDRVIMGSLASSQVYMVAWGFAMD